MDKFYNGVPHSEERNYRKETMLHIRNKKMWLVATVCLAMVADAVVAVLLGLVTKGAFYWVVPACLALVDALFLVDLFFINLQQRYSILHRVVFVIISAILAVIAVVLPSYDVAHTVMSMTAALLVMAVQVVKIVVVLVLSILGKYPTFRIGQRVWSILLMLFVGLLLTAYVGLNIAYGFMGQRISYFDTDCTLVFALDENGTYRVEDCYQDGNVIDVPTTFNGKRVTSLNCNVLRHDFVTKVNIYDADFLFVNVDEPENLTTDRNLTINVPKSGMDNVRRSLFNQAWTATTASMNARVLFSSVCPSDLRENEVFYNVSFGDVYSKDKLQYIPTIIKNKNEPLVLADIAAITNAEYLQHKNKGSQEDLQWCYLHNDGYIVNSDIGISEKGASISFERVYQLQLVQGNDSKWQADEGITVQFISESQASRYFASLPQREGFDVTWVTADERVDFADGMAFARYVSTAGKDINIKPAWRVQPPEIYSVESPSDFAITYGENTDMAVTATGILPIVYTLKKGNTVLATNEDGHFALNQKVPADSGTYTVSLVARNAAISSLQSEAVTRDFTFTVRKKKLDLEWTLPAGEFSNTERAIYCAANGVVNDYDTISFMLDRQSVFDAGEYTVTATLYSDTAAKYYFAAEDATKSFTVTPKNIMVDWTGDTFIYNGQAQCPTATTNVFGQVVGLQVRETNVHAGDYTAEALAIDGNYVIGANPTKAYTIQKKEVWVSNWSSSSFLYNAQEQKPRVEALLDVVEGEESVALDDLRYNGDTQRKNVGNYSISAVFAESSNYRFAAGDTGTVKEFVIAPMAVSVAEWDARSFVFAALPQKPTVLAVDGCVADEDAAVIASLQYSDYSSNINKGSGYTISVTLPAESNYYFAAVQSVTYDITPYQTTVQWSDVNLVFNTQEQHPTVVIKGVNGVDVGYSLTGGATNAGDGYIAYVMSTDANYELVGDTAMPYVISPYGVAVIWDNLTLVYNGDAQTPTATGNDLNEHPLFINVEGEQVNAGTRYNATASIVGNGNYYIKNSQREFIITPLDVEAAWSGMTLTYNGKPQAPTAAVVGVKGSSVEVSIINAKQNVGSYVAFVTTTDSNYNITNPSVAYTINPMSVSVSWGINVFTYNGKAQIPTAEAIGAEDEIIVLNCTGAQSAASAEAYTATASTANTNYQLQNTSVDFTILPKTIVIEWANDVFQYNGRAQVPTATATALIAGDECGLSVEGEQIDAGTDYTAVVVALSNPNYKLPMTGLTFDFVIERIARPAAEVTYAIRSIYGEARTAPVVSGNNEDGAVTHAYKQKAQSDEYYTAIVPVVPGDYVLRTSIAQTTNYIATVLVTEFHIDKRPVELKWGEIDDLVYDKMPKVPDVTVDNLVEGDVVVVEANVSEGENNVQVGRFTFTAVSLNNDKYTLVGGINVVSGGYTIVPKAAALSWSALSEAQLVYSASTKVLTAEVGNLEAGDECDVTVALGKGMNAYHVGLFNYCAVALSNENYTLSGATKVVSDWYEITKKELVINVRNHTLVYGDPIGNNGADIEGLAGDDTVESIYLNLDYTYVATFPVTYQIEPIYFAGEYVISCSYSYPFDYDVTLHKGTLIILQKTVNIAWSHTSFEYDGSEHIPTATAEGLVNGDVVELTVEGKRKNAGNGYTATVTAIDNENYVLLTEAAARSVTFSIVPRTLDVVADDFTIGYLDAAPTYTYHYGGHGFATGESEADLTTAPGVACAYVAGDDVGTYAIVASGATADNYAFNYVNGTLRVTPIDRSKPVVGIEGWTYGQDANAPAVTNEIDEEEGTAVIYLYGVAGEEETTAEVPAAAGDYYVVAVLSASTNYNSATSEPCAFTIERKDRELPVVSIEGWVVGDEANAPAVINEIAEEEGTVVIYLYGVAGEEETTAEVPTVAGDYYVVAVLSASADYKAAMSEPCAFSITEA